MTHSLLVEHVQDRRKLLPLQVSIPPIVQCSNTYESRKRLHLDNSCVLCARCFHATEHTGHNASLFIAQQTGGCCDCGDDEAWRRDIVPTIHKQDLMIHKIPHHWYSNPFLTNSPAPHYAFRVDTPSDLQGFHVTNNRIRTWLYAWHTRLFAGWANCPSQRGRSLPPTFRWS